MGSINVNTKVCATCQYWSGSRELSSKNVIHYDGKGTCTASRSGFKGKETRGLQHCGHWFKWVAIK